MDEDRDRMRALSSRLLRLHSLLLDRERRAYEERHGSVASRELLQLLLHDEQFSWLRSLSSMIAKIDDVVDAQEPIPPGGLRSALREARIMKTAYATAERIPGMIPAASDLATDSPVMMA